MTLKKILHLVIVFTVIVSPTLYADNIWDMASSDSYGRKAGGMFGRGLLNAATCFLDIIVQTVDKTKDGPPVVGTLTGIGSGAACTVLRAGSGVVDVASFWVPGFNGVPVSRSYHNCIETEETQPVPQEAYGTVYQAPAVSTPSTTVVSPAYTSNQDPMKYVKK